MEEMIPVVSFQTITLKINIIVLESGVRMLHDVM
jgi:hypothetical protein